MTAATIPDTGLDWVTFTDEDQAEACSYRTDPCSRQATHIAIFRLVDGGCAHIRPRFTCCLIHRDRILRDATKVDGLFCCYTCWPLTIVELVRMVAL